MSLIEKAIEKIQKEQPTAGSDPRGGAGLASHGGVTGPFGKVVSAAPTRAAELGRQNWTPARIIAINEVALRSAGLLPPEHQARSISREYQQIKRPLIANADRRRDARVPDGHLVMIASAIPGEGKTFTSINLAFSLALEKDLNVVLVDADILKPHISKLLGVDKEPGLLDVLQDSARDIESVILPTSIPGLSVLPAGSRCENPTELLASERMREIMKHMSERDSHRIVLFDSPPLLLTTESQALAQIAGQIVVVVRAGLTPQRAVLDALSHLGEGKSVALVLNQSVAASPTNYYFYGKDREGLEGLRAD